ncbi:MAG: class I SAM-dependent DNA methyltransferase, partial [Armatimonadota bacterium]|nr:class I SAM-dependent DNA methyltransferase [Armatimonadota bacterium]
MNASAFITKWGRSTLTERSAAQQHFLDLCELLGHPKPAAADPTGESFTFEKGAAKSTGGQGWADVWKRGCFGWEYKGKHKDLDAAYQQLLRYSGSLENPPLLVVSDMERIVIHTNFTGFPTRRHEIALDALDDSYYLGLLRDVFEHPERFKPGESIEKITERAARKLGEVARTMGQRGAEPTAVARFLDRIVFCLFAEDIDLLPGGLFSRLLETNRFNPARCSKLIGDLFVVMATGGDFGEHFIRRFNGNLFNEELRFELTQSEIDAVREASRMDWKNVDASIFGTLFERGLDPTKRSQLGAHYTSRADIETLIEPVILQPLRREWEQVRGQAEVALAEATPLPPGGVGGGPGGAGRQQAVELIRQFLARLSSVRILDPACGSGNFLYVALQKLKDLEKTVLLFAHDNGLGEYAPSVRPEQLFGIEVNLYAFDLAQTTVWIGYLQWLRDNGYLFIEDPVLRKNDNFRCMDAILDLSDPAQPREPEWPEADFIVGNPPFLGGSRLWEELGRDYQQKLWKVYEGRVPGFADLCCYWFEKARQQIVDSRCQRAGLLATQAIRGGANRQVLKRTKETGDIFFAVSDRNWINEGANVHVSLIGFDNGSQMEKTLDDHPVASIHADLSSAADVTQAQRLKANFGLSFIGTKKAGKFNLPEAQALQILDLPNPHGKPNSDVLRPWLSGEAIVQRPAPQWIIDPGTNMTQEEFSLYE